MITREGYSKDPSIIPCGIAVTFSESMINEQGGLKLFLKQFNDDMKEESNCWLHKCKNKPVYDEELMYVYIIIAKRIYARCYYGGYQTGETRVKTTDNKIKNIDWSRIVMSGPIEKPQVKIHQKGFRGFRYTTKLF